MAVRNILVCDRCGKEIKYKGWTGKLRSIFFGDKNSYIRYCKLLDGNPSGYDYSDRSYELCTECTNKLDEFLMGRADIIMINKIKEI